MKQIKLKVSNKSATIIIAKKIAKKCKKSCIIFLSGEIGSGKTTFCQAFIRELGYNGIINSPTYHLFKKYYLNKFNVYHFDFYLFSNKRNVYLNEIKNSVNSKDIFLIEWPEYGKDIFLKADIEINIKYTKQNRALIIKSYSNLGDNILDLINKNLFLINLK